MTSGCLHDDGGDGALRDYREDMRTLVQRISNHAKAIDGDFIIIPQNGHELLTLDGEPDGQIAQEYADAIDGVGREDLFYGYDDDNVATPASERDWMLSFMDRFEGVGVEVLVTDYCWSESHMDYSYDSNDQRDFISFAADSRELDNVPDYPDEPFNVHDGDVSSLSDSRNFLYLINPDAFAGKDAFLDAVRATDYDLVIIDLFYDGVELTEVEVASLKVKAGGGSRLVIAYMSIGEAEDYRYYWQSTWEDDPPSWMEGENPDWPGNYKVKYWDAAWQDIIYDGDDSYLDRILDAGFDGVYLDIIDAFEYFE